MTEYVTKEQVKEEILSWARCITNPERLVTEDTLYVIDALPAADVRPVVRSQWKKNDNGTYSCKRCHSWIPEEQWHYANWCLYCGADMRGGDAE